MNINKVKEYGEFVEIAAPVERTTAEEYPTVLGGEICLILSKTRISLVIVL